MLLIALQFINEGGNTMLALSCTLYFLKLKVEPTEATYYLCLIMIPEALGFFWGMLIDTVDMRGRRGHIILGATL
jgi:hypothetical protein